jgi:hypothetical protein
MKKIIPLFLGFLLVAGSVNAGLITGAFKWLTKSKTVTKIGIDDVATHFPWQVPYQGSNLLRGECDKKSLNSLEAIYQAAAKGIVEAQRRFVDEWPSYEKKCNWIDKTKNKANFEAYRRLYKDLRLLKRVILRHPNRIKDARINELRRKIIESEFHEYLIK